ncbi:mutator type transposase, partial [Tanacetum coccineum]
MAEHKLKERNPDTTVKIDVERDYEPDSMTRQFRRIYVCLGALKSRFKVGQRDLLGLDGCFMSGPFPMQILTAVGVDPNYGIYPLAYAIVESKNKQAWLWFLDCLGDDLELFRNSNFKFVTDRQKELIPALAETFPAAEHRNMEELKAIIVKDGRDKPIITCLEFIREYIMKRIVIVQQVISKGNGPLTPKATKVFEVIKKLVSQYPISWNGGNLYQAVGPKVGAIWNMTENGLELGIPESWVHHSYWLATWEEMYRFKINPCNGPDLWPPSDSPITYTPPEYHKPASRPSKKRKKSVAELFDGLVKNGKLS